ESQAQQAHEDGKVVPTARFHRQRLLDEQFEQLFQGSLGFGLGLTAIQFLFQTGAEWPEEAREDRLNKRLLGTEVVVDGRQVDPCLAGNQPQRGFGEAFLREQLFRSIENAFNGFRLSHELSPDKHLFETYVSGSRIVKSRKPSFGRWVTAYNKQRRRLTSTGNKPGDSALRN